MLQLVKIIIPDIGIIRIRNTTITAHKPLNKQKFKTKKLHLN